MSMHVHAVERDLYPNTKYCIKIIKNYSAIIVCINKGCICRNGFMSHSDKASMKTWCS